MIERAIRQTILDIFTETQVVYINGARQSGKSTLALQIAQTLDMEYVTFDDITMYAAAKHDPEAFIKNIKTNIVLDEVQMVPEIFRCLKQYIDESRVIKRTNKILLTGSANILALPKLSDALVGRMRIITLHPLAFAECQKKQFTLIDRLFSNDFRLQKNAADGVTIIDAIKLATFPELSVSQTLNKEQWFESYLMTLLRRDIQDLANIEKISDLPLMLKTMATRVGSLINESSLARDCNCNLMTFRRYRALLENMFIVSRISPWLRNLSKRLVKTSKNYFSDTNMLCYLLGMDLNNTAQKNPIIFGHILENFVATELNKHLASAGGVSLFHFRTQDNYEVDFVLEKNNGDLVGIEVKSNSSVNIGDFKGLKKLQELTSDSFKCGIVLYTGIDVVPFANNMFAVPIMLNSVVEI